MKIKSDQELLIGLKKGESWAVRQWYRQYHRRLLNLILQKVSSHEDAQELVQDVFVSCLKHLPLFRGESGIWTWMYRIARHEVADYYRKKYAKKALKTLALDEFLLIDNLQGAAEVNERVRQALGNIRRDYRELLLLKYIDKKKVAQIASDWQRSVKSIESDLFRARRAFRAAFLEIAQEYEDNR